MSQAPGVLPDTRSRVMEAAEALGYQPNIVARTLRQGTTRTIGLVVAASLLAESPYLQAIPALRLALLEHGYKLTVTVLAPGELLDDTATEPLVWCAAVAFDAGAVDRVERLAGAPQPVVVIGRLGVPANLPANVSRIEFDEAEGVRQAVLHLAAQGHRNIGFVGGPPDDPETTLREQGFRAGMEFACLPIRPEWIVRCGPGADIPNGREAYLKASTASHARLTAVACSHDAMAIEVIRAAGAFRRFVPELVSVVGFGDTSAARASVPPLTSVILPGAELGAALADWILRHCGDPSLPAETTQLPAVLSLRNSTAPCVTRLLRPPEAPAPQAEEPADPDAPRACLRDGLYEVRARHSGFLLDVPNGAQVADGPLWQWMHTGGNAQLWHVEHAGGGWYTIRNAGSWYYLDADARCPNFTALIQNPRDNANPDIQLWRLDEVEPGSGYHRVTNKARNLVVDVAGAGMTMGIPVIAFTWNGDVENENQQWAFDPVPVPSGDYEMLAVHSSKALDIPRASLLSGTVPCQTWRRHNVGQRWRFTHLGASRYRIHSVLSNLALQAVRFPSLSAALMREDPATGDLQTWRVDTVDVTQPTVRITNVALDLVLEIPGSRHDDASIALGEWSGSTNQQWVISDEDLA